MNFFEKWIWLPTDRYPDRQTTKYSFSDTTDHNKDAKYTVAEFKRKYSFDKNIIKATIRFSGDTEFVLFLNGNMLATGPVAVGGDFLGQDSPRDNFYASVIDISPDTHELDFFARVKMLPTRWCDYSKGHGGFMLSAHIIFDDGTKTVISPDKTWQARFNGAYTSPTSYDARIIPDEYVSTEAVDNIWLTETAPLPIRTETEIYPSEHEIALAPFEEKEVFLDLDMIHAGFLHVIAKTQGELFVDIICRETADNKGKCESLTFVNNDNYRGFWLHSVGEIICRIKNNSAFPASLSISIIGTHYPIENSAMTTTDDTELNTLLDICRHTLKYCRQTLHLDSPKHCEPLACAGDYYIESLMTLFSFGDMRLAEFDILRIAELLRGNDGRIFHTTYSLIWVRWMRDIYEITGNVELLRKCEDALIMLLNRFETYIGDTGLIETPPDYMFVDWIYIDGLSMHHPPKALGQTCLNMFYFGALDSAANIFDTLSDNSMAELCRAKRDDLKAAVNGILFDSEKGLYFEGLNTPTPERLGRL